MQDTIKKMTNGQLIKWINLSIESIKESTERYNHEKRVGWNDDAVLTKKRLDEDKKYLSLLKKEVKNRGFNLVSQ